MELEQYLTQEEIEKLKQDKGRMIARIRIPDHIHDLTCFNCGASLIGEVFAEVYYLPFTGKVTCHDWYIRHFICHCCIDREKENAVFVNSYIIPSLQFFLEWLLEED